MVAMSIPTQYYFFGGAKTNPDGRRRKNMFSVAKKSFVSPFHFILWVSKSNPKQNNNADDAETKCTIDLLFFVLFVCLFCIC